MLTDDPSHASGASGADAAHVVVWRDDNGLAFDCESDGGLSANEVAARLERYSLRVSNWNVHSTSASERALLALVSAAMASHPPEIRSIEWPIRIDRATQPEPEVFDAVADRIVSSSKGMTIARFQAIEREAISALVKANDREDLRGNLHWSL